MKKILFFFVSSLIVNLSLQAQSWSNLSPGTESLKAFEDGINTMCLDKFGNMYVAGELVDSNRNKIVAKWDGSAWSYLGVGSSILNSYSEIQTMVIDTSGNIYVGGENGDSATYVAKWDGTSWSILGIGFITYGGGNVLSICFDKYGNIYAAGSFPDTAGYLYVAKWDGISWSELGTGSNALKANSAINTIFADTLGNVYAAGNFTDSLMDTSGNLYVAKWDGTSWSELGTGVCPEFGGWDGQIFSILPDTAGNIYAAGWLTPDSEKTYVSKWDGTSWTKLMLDSAGVIFSLCFDIQGNLYAGGQFGYSYYNGNQNVFKWDGTSWGELGVLNANEGIYALCSDASGNIYAGGEFTDTTTTIYFDSAYPNIHPYYVAKYSIPTTGIAPLHATPGITVYPNPTTDELNINGVPENTNYRLLNVTGVCAQLNILQQNNVISLKNVIPGMYILELTDNSGSRNIIQVVKE